MKRITFEQFVKSYNFRCCTNNPAKPNNCDYDTGIIRIYFDDCTNHDWFEFGYLRLWIRYMGEHKKILNPKNKKPEIRSA